MENFKKVDLKDEILASCNALGFMEGSIYKKEPDCFQTLKEIIKYLKIDGPLNEARYFLGRSSTVSNDLLPLIIYYNDDIELFNIIIKLLANLTHPILLLYNNKKPNDINGQKRFVELNDILLAYKKDCANLIFFSILQSKLKTLVEKDWEDTFDEDNLQIEYILILVRNLLIANESNNPYDKIRIYSDGSDEKDAHSLLIEY
ncbi:unnamed protein product [Gordionus sp. m RMFG-2023]